MALMDLAVTVLYVVACIVLGFGVVLLPIMLPVLLCWGESAEERAGAERRAAALVAVVERALAQRRLASAAPVEHAPVARATAAAVMAKLGYFPYSEEGRRASEKLVCAVCLEVFEHGATCSEVPACRHLFHRDCIDVGMKTKTTCPLCRGDIVAGSERVSAADDMV